MATKIGVVGAGNVGGTVARLFAGAGYEVAVSNSRGPDTLHDLVQDIGHGAQALTAEEAVAFGEIVVVAVPLGRYRDVPVTATAGKIVIDTDNYYPQRDGQITVLDDDTTTSSQLLAEHLPDARVVKALNVIPMGQLASMGQPPGAAGRIAIPIAGEDADAKRVVAELIDRIGYDSVDVGSLSDTRVMQPNAPLSGVSLTAADVRQVLAAQR